jgi:hypothetical protein
MASLAISMSWHVLLLAVLALAVHPLPAPRDALPITVELLPPLAPPREPPILRELPEDRPIPPRVQPQPVLSKPVEVKPTTPPVLRRLTEAPQPPLPVPPAPEPPQVAPPPQPVLAQPTEVTRRPSPAPPRLIETPRALPRIPQPAEAEPPKSVSPPQTAPPLTVLTNDRAVQAPVEIRPPDRTAIAPRSTTLALPRLPAGADVGAGASSPGGSASTAAGSGSQPFNGRIVGFDDNGVRGGLRMRLGCENPDTYHLSPEDKAACLRRLAEEAKAAAGLGINIPEGKQAQYDRQAACHTATTARGAVPGSTSASASTGRVTGLGDNPRLRDCGPGDR